MQPEDIVVTAVFETWIVRVLIFASRASPFLGLIVLRKPDEGLLLIVERPQLKEPRSESIVLISFCLSLGVVSLAREKGK